MTEGARSNPLVAILISLGLLIGVTSGLCTGGWMGIGAWGMAEGGEGGAYGAIILVMAAVVGAPGVLIGLWAFYALGRGSPSLRRADRGIAVALSLVTVGLLGLAIAFVVTGPSELPILILAILPLAEAAVAAILARDFWKRTKP